MWLSEQHQYTEKLPRPTPQMQYSMPVMSQQIGWLSLVSILAIVVAVHSQEKKYLRGIPYSAS